MGRHSWAGVGEEFAEGWKLSVQIVGGKISNKRHAQKEEAAAWVRNGTEYIFSLFAPAPYNRPAVGVQA